MPTHSTVDQQGQTTEMFSPGASKDHKMLDLLRKVESLKTDHDEAFKDNSETLKIYSELDKAHAKLIK